MIAYLLKSGLCLALLLAFYHLILEKEKMHQFNRFYLLGSVLFSFIVPSFIIYVEVANINNQSVTYAEKSVIADQSFLEQYMNVEYIVLSVYLLVSFIFLIRFIKNLYHIIQKIRTNEIIRSKYASFVLVSDEILPHTFWNYIFINEKEYHSQAIEDELFTHELAHVTQKHTIDILIMELLQVAFWFNPLFFILKKAIQLNHEFLADDKVIASHNNITRYQSLLLNKAAWKNEYYLASNLNYSLTKKRLLMMKTPNSRATILVKKLAIIPLIAGLVFLFADRVAAQTSKNKPKPITVIEVKEASKANMEEYKALIKAAEKQQAFKFKDVKRLRYLYSLMSSKQKRTVKDINDLLPPPPPPMVVEGKKRSKVKVVQGKKRPPKPVMPVKIEVIKKGKKRTVKEIPPPPKKKTKNSKTKVIEIIEIPTEEKEEEIEKIEVIETQEIVEIEEVEEEAPETTEKIEIVIPEQEELETVVETPRVVVKLDYKKLKKDGAKFYLNGKKISARKAKKYFYEKSNLVKDVEVQKNKGKAVKVDINTRGKKVSNAKIKEALLKMNAYANRNNLDPRKNRNTKKQRKEMLAYLELLNAYSNSNTL